MTRSARPDPDRPTRRWLTAANVRLHAVLVVGVAGCLAAGWFELTRALDGHEIAWVYAVEWPLFAIVGTYIWWKLLHVEEAGSRPVPTNSTPQPPEQDGQLAAWQEYLQALQAADPPGGPPDPRR